MFWDKISSLYDLFENIYNRKVYNGTGLKVAEMIGSSDDVLECACGTGAISKCIAPACGKLVATDFSEGMLKQARRKCGAYKNMIIEKADITHPVRIKQIPALQTVLRDPADRPAKPDNIPEQALLFHHEHASIGYRSITNLFLC